MNKVLALLLASVLLLRFSPSAALQFVETDRSGEEGSHLTSRIDVRSGDIPDEINVTALTFAAFQTKYPDLELTCISSDEIQAANKAEENDFSAGTTAVNLQGATTIFPIEFITLTQDEIDEPEEVFLLILENRDGPLTRPVIQNNIQVNETIICSVGIIQESDSDAVLIQLNETSLQLREDAGNVNLTIVRNGASELEREIMVKAGVSRCRGLPRPERDIEEIVVPTMITLPPTNEEVSELTLQIKIVNDDIPESDECLSVQLVSSDIAVEGQTDIVILDDDDLRIGWNFTQQNGLLVEEGQSIDVCAAILEPQGEISSALRIELDIEHPASDGKFTVEPAETGFILVSGFTLFSEFRAFCFRVTATNDSNMEEDLTFGIKLFKTMNISARVTIEPDVVMVTITDNDEPQTIPTPQITSVSLADGNDLDVIWRIPDGAVQPVDDYRVDVRCVGRVDSESVNTLELLDDSIECRSANTMNSEALFPDVELRNITYLIRVCVQNGAGEICSGYEIFTPPLPPQPEITSVILFDGDDLDVNWRLPNGAIQPVDNYRVEVRCVSRVDTAYSITASELLADSAVYRNRETEDTDIIFFDVNTNTKTYLIRVCAQNRVGTTCSEYEVFTPPLVSEPSNLSPGIIAVIVIVSVLGCCCCWLWLIVLFCWCKRDRERKGKYYPFKKEKKHHV